MFWRSILLAWYLFLMKRLRRRVYLMRTKNKISFIKSILFPCLSLSFLGVSYSRMLELALKFYNDNIDNRFCLTYHSKTNNKLHYSLNYLYFLRYCFRFSFSNVFWITVTAILWKSNRPRNCLRRSNLCRTDNLSC